MKKTTNNILKAMPQSQEAEQALLGSLLIDNEVAFNVLSSIAPTDFYFEANALIYECMQKIFRANKPIDYITLVDELENSNLLASIGGIEYITTLTNIVPSAVNYGSYLDIVKRTSILRQLISISKDIAEKAYDNPTKDEAIGYAEKLIYDLAQNEDTSDLEHIASSLKNVIDRFDRITKDKSMSKGILTGITELDNITNGLQNSDLILIAARPGVGKTSLAMNIVNNAAIKGGASVAVFNLEMPRVQLAQRSICSLAFVSMEKALKGELNVQEWKALWAASDKLNKAKIFVDDSSLNTPVDILSKCRRLKAEHGLDLVMIDYLQLMSSGGKSKDNRQQEVADMSRGLKIMARELNVPVIVLSQLSRAVESRQGKVPVLSDLRESGAIEQDADIVMFIHKPDIPADAPEELKRNPICEIIIAKHRNGALGEVKVKWVGNITTFVNLERDANEQSLDELAPPPMPNNSAIDESMPEIVPLEDSDITDIF